MGVDLYVPYRDILRGAFMDDCKLLQSLVVCWLLRNNIEVERKIGGFKDKKGAIVPVRGVKVQREQYKKAFQEWLADLRPGISLIDPPSQDLSNQVRARLAQVW